MFRDIIYKRKINGFLNILTNKSNSQNIYHYRINYDNKFEKIKVYNKNEISIDDIIKLITYESFNLIELRNDDFI
jgi:hypothetical protein